MVFIKMRVPVNARDLGLTDDLVVQWNSFIEVIKESGIRLNSGNDFLVQLKNNKNGNITTKKACDYISRN